MDCLTYMYLFRQAISHQFKLCNKRQNFKSIERNLVIYRQERILEKTPVPLKSQAFIGTPQEHSKKFTKRPTKIARSPMGHHRIRIRQVLATGGCLLDPSGSGIVQMVPVLLLHFARHQMVQYLGLRRGSGVSSILSSARPTIVMVLYQMVAYLTFDLLKAFSSIERVVKSYFFLGNDLFYIILAHNVLSFHLI